MSAEILNMLINWPLDFTNGVDISPSSMLSRILINFNMLGSFIKH